MIVLPQKADETAPVPAKISATDSTGPQCSSTVRVIKGKSLYLLPRYRRLLICDVLKVVSVFAAICFRPPFSVFIIANPISHKPDFGNIFSKFLPDFCFMRLKPQFKGYYTTPGQPWANKKALLLWLIICHNHINCIAFITLQNDRVILVEY